jgi:dihydroorotate dehydrogenase (fumarate)/dihydroorotate dehydrogenase
VSLYASLLRPVLFRGDAERMHDYALRAAEKAGGCRTLCSMARAWSGEPDPRLRVEAAGLRFAHPVGLAAGFDKNGRGIPFWAALGFSHAEIGSVSAWLSLGNPRPRLFRIPEDRGIVVNYGLPNDGAERVAARLAQIRTGIPLGINVVNTNRGPGAAPESDDAVIDDYVRSVRILEPHAGYLALNLSCPNTRDGRAFVSDACRVAALLDAVGALKPQKPVFLKVAPFASLRELESFLKLAERADYVRGFEVNLPPGKPPGLRTPPGQLARMPGAVSGKPCEAASNRTIAELYRSMDRARYAIIGAGGVFTAGDAYLKLRLGASLVQVLTALVYEGPGAVRRIRDGLAALLERDGFSHAGGAVGVEAA